MNGNPTTPAPESRLEAVARSADRAWPVGLVGWIAGFWWFPDGWWHLLWFVVAGALPFLACASGRRVIAGLGADPACRLVIAWAGWVAASTVMALVASGDLPPSTWWRLPLLALQFVGILVLVAGVRALATRGLAGRVLAWSAGAGAVAATASFVVWYGIEGHPFPRARLRDVFVYADGLHPVLTGLLAGFSSLAAAACAAGARSRGRRSVWLAAQAVLVAAVFFSHSRGAILAAVAGFAAFVGFVGPRRSWPALAVFAGVVLFYQFGASRFSSDERRTFERGAPTPAHELVGRRDNGRMELYRALLARLDSPAKWIAGRGLLADRSAGTDEIRWDAPHPHSAYLATLLIGGIGGLVALSAATAAVARRAWSARRSAGRADGGDVPFVAAWSALFVLGLVGLLFDGDNLLAIRTIPRVEALLFWVPWAVLSTVGPARGDRH